MFFIADIDECREFLGICQNGQCVNTPGTFRCVCLPGYTLSSDGMNCRGKCTFAHQFSILAIKVLLVVTPITIALTFQEKGKIGFIILQSV